MISASKSGLALLACLLLSHCSFSQARQNVTVKRSNSEKKIDILFGKQLFTSFWYPDTLEKPVLFPIQAANNTVVTRGYPINPKPDEPTDHPHHIGIWFNFENVNGLDFWNNSFAIAEEKKHLYGWIKTDRILETTSGNKGVLSYHANWTNKANSVLLQETTRLEFSGTANQRIIDRITTLKADTVVLFKDAKDGFLGIRLAHELQIPTTEDKKFTDDKGNVTVVKSSTDNIANGNYVTREGKLGDSVWSTRSAWCKVYGKMGNDSISVTIIDHPKNPNYPTYWHARGYGLFAANPLGEQIFTNGKKATNLQLKKGESVTFRYRVVINNGAKTPAPAALNTLAASFAKMN